MSDKDERYQVAYAEALRAISDQQTALDALQNRAGTIVSAGAIAMGLIGVARFRGASVGIAGIVAVFLLLAIVILTGLILWPRREWRFHFRASYLHWNYIEGPSPLSLGLMKRDLGLHLEAYFQENARRIDRFTVMLSVAIVLLFGESVAVVLEVWR